MSETLLHQVTGAVVVGVDGSEHSDRAIVWAAEQAATEGRPLVLVHCAGGPHGTLPEWLVLDTLEEVVTAAARSLVEEAEQLVEDSVRGLTVRTAVVDLDPRDALIAITTYAHLVVVGSHGRSLWQRVALGSVSAAVTQHAGCPVIVVGDQSGVAPHPVEPRGGVLVGADGQAGSLPVIEFAFRYASQHALPLTVMHCYWDIAGEIVYGRHVGADESGVEDLRLLLSESVAGMAEKFPDVAVDLQLARGLVDVVLNEEKRSHALVVVGRRQPTWWSRLLYASATTAVLDRARTTVAVVPEPVPEPVEPDPEPDTEHEER